MRGRADQCDSQGDEPKRRMTKAERDKLKEQMRAFFRTDEKLTGKERVRSDLELDAEIGEMILQWEETLDRLRNS